MKLRWIASALVVTLLVPSVLPAQPMTDDAARRAYEAGEAAFAAGNFEAAFAAWDAAWQLSGRVELLYNLALAAEANGDFATALEYLELYRERGENVDVDALDEWAAVLREQIAAETIDDVESVALEGSGVGVDEGDQVEHVELVEPVELAAAPEGNDEGSGITQLPETRPEPPRDRAFGRSEVVLTVVSSAAFMAAIGMGAATLKLREDLEGACATDAGGWICPTSQRDRAAREQTLGVATDVALVVGVAGTATLIGLLLADGRDERVSAAVAPIAGGVAFSLGGRF